MPRRHEVLGTGTTLDLKHTQQKGQAASRWQDSFQPKPPISRVHGSQVDLIIILKPREASISCKISGIQTGVNALNFFLAPSTVFPVT